MGEHLEGLTGFPQQFQILIMGDNSLSKVHRSVNDRLLLFSFQDTGDDTLSCYTIPSVVDNNRPQSVKSFDIHGTVCLDSLQVITGSNVCCSIPSQLLVVVPDIE